MKLRYVLLVFTLLSILFNPLRAQSKTGRKIDLAGKDIEKAAEAVENSTKLIKGIFKKEDKDHHKKEEKNTDDQVPDGSRGNTKIGESPERGETDEIAKKEPVFGPTGPNPLKPGDVHPDAVVLDVDELFPFYNGAAMVKKGTSTALINAKGEFIVPFNKYLFNDFQNDSKNGFFLLSGMFTRPDDANGFVNAKGKFIDLQEFYGVTEDSRVIGNYLRLRERQNRYTFYFVDMQGNKYTLTDLGPVSSSEDAILNNGRVAFAKNYKYGYKNIENKIVINAKYDFAMPFSEGAAVVGAKNEFGEIKYGYIDIDGKPITPLQFSNPPESFSNGRAKVFYNDLTTYSFIDKNGQVVYTKNNPLVFGPFFNGYSLGKSPERIMDKDGTIYTKEEFLELFGVSDVQQGSASIELPTTLISVYLNFGSPNKIKFLFDSTHGVRYNGFINVDAGSAIYGKFSTGYGKQNFDFGDPLSKLAYAVFDKPKNPGDIREGYINEEGIFMIVKRERSQW